jgi:hypothetical protein
MSEWWTYGLSDFLMFSPRVYYRQFELHNQQLWPAHLLVPGLAIWMLFVVLRPTAARGRAIALAMGLIVTSVGWAFLWERYAAINWAALYVAPAFGLQGALLLAAAFSPGGLALEKAESPSRWRAAALLVFAFAIYPLLAPAFGRPWLAAEVVGLAPDPTAVGVLAMLAASRARLRGLLMVIPALWCALTGMTQWAMGAPDFWIAPAGALAALAAAAANRSSAA